MALAFNSLITTTLQKFKNRMTDNIFSGRFFTAYMTQAGRFENEDGGRTIVEPLIYAQNANWQTYSMYDTLNTAATDEFTAAEYPWRQAGVMVSFAGLEDAQN